MLHANTTSSCHADVEAAFPTAQHVRELLADHGFIPLVRVGNGEHWVRAGRRLVLTYEGDIPADVLPSDLRFATLVRMGHWPDHCWTISLD